MIELKAVEVIFNKKTPLEKRALCGIDLKIEEGEFVSIIGGNGAGKTTLLNVLSGDFGVESGSILIDGKDVTKHSTEKRAKLVSRVFQDPMLGTCSELSIEENLALANKRGRFRGLGMALNQEKRDYFASVLSGLGIGLESRMTDPMKSLSGGQRQAVSLLMSTLLPSKIILLDEHTAALDPKMAERIMELTQRLIIEHKLTALMITHSMHQALDFGSRTLLMQEGHIIQDLHGNERAQLTPADLIKLFK